MRWPIRRSGSKEGRSKRSTQPSRSFAHSVWLRFPAEQAEVEVDYKDVQLDPELAPALFELPQNREAASR